MSGTIGKNINSLPVNPIDRKISAEKIKPVSLFTEEEIVPAKLDGKELSAQSTNTKSTGSINFVDNNPTENNINKSLDDFENNITALVKTSGNKLSPTASREIFNSQVDLKRIILQNKLKTPEDIENLSKVISPMLIELNKAGGLDEKTEKSFNSLTQGIINKTGENIGSNLKLESVNGKTLGISSSKQISEDKSQVVKKLGDMSFDIEKIKTEKGGLTPYKVVLMGMRDEILRHSYESLARHPENIVSPTPIYKDLGIISNAVSTIDSMLSSTRNLPPNMLSDMQSTVDSIVSAPVGQLEETLNKLDTKIPEIKLPEQNTQFDTPKIPTLPNGKDFNTAPINKANNILLDIVKGTPRGVGDSVKDAINSYSSVMNTVENNLPPFLPRPVTLKTPINFNDGNGNSFNLASGSQISQKGKGFEINSPGLSMGLGGTTLSSQNSVIQLGNNGIDNLSFDNLNIKDKDTNTNISGFKAQIDRNNGSSLLKADKATIDMQNGKVDLTNASFVQNPDGSTNLSAQSFLYDKDNTHVGFNNFQASQSEKDGVAKLGLSAANIDLNTNNTQINADKFSFQMTHSDNSDITDMANISAENVKVVSAGNIVKADNANLDIKVNKDGSSSTVISSLNPSVDMASGKIAVKGQTVISINQDKNGDLSNFNAKADELNYSGKDENLDVKDGNLNIDFSNGNIKDITASASKVHFDNKDQVINATGANLALNFGDNNQLKDAEAKVATLDFSSEQGKLGIKDGDVKLNFNDKGNLSSINSSIKDINWAGKNGEIINAKNTSLDANFFGNGNISQINTKLGSADYTGSNGDKLNITNGSASVSLDENGFLKNATGKVDKLRYENISGDKINASGLDININGDKNGLTDASVKIGKLDYLNGKGDKFGLTNGSLNLTENSEGILTNANGKAEKLSFENLNGDKINASGLDININGDKNGLTDASVKIGNLDYLNAKGDKFNLTNGAATISRDSDGFINNVTGKAEKLSFESLNGDKVNASGLDININGDKNGLTDASIKIGQLDYLSGKGDKLNLTNGSASLIRDSEGLISNIKGHADNLNLISKDGNTINANGLNINIDAIKGSENQYNMSASVNDLQAHLKEQNLDIKASDISASLNPDQMKLHVGSAEVIQKMEKELNVKIENLDVLVDKNKDGNMKGFDLQVAGIDGKIQGMELQVKTQNGERLRLNMSMSDDGKVLKEAFLKIPTGGEIKLQKDDLNVRLGEQTIKFTQDGKGLYTLRDDGLNIDASTKDAKIHVAGGSAQISLDAKSGNIIIDEIKGTKINAEFGSNKVDVDIKEIKGFVVKATGLSGPVTGAMLELKPTGEDSNMTASISAKVGGIPVKVDLKDVHELKMLGSMSENEARVYVGDPSGRGNIKIQAGPLKLEGSAIDFLARYHTYDSQRMMSSMSRYLSTDGLQLGPLGIEPDGVVRLEKQSPGLHLGASFILPRGILEDDNRFDLSNQPSLNKNANSWGMITSIGGQGKSADGTNYVGNIYAGLVPGSFVSIDRKQGDMSLFNIPTPSHITIPSTVVGGLGFRRHGSESRLDATIGGFVNPVGLLPKDSPIPLKDSVKYGGFAGFNYRKDNYQFGLDGLLDVNKENKVSPSFRASFSLRF